MREPDLDQDGWCLDDGEEYHRAAPATFQIPDLEAREALRPGDLAKLIFRISVDDASEPVAVERMWVLVRERQGARYFGRLDNDPECIEPNEELWSGVEVPFSARHVIAVDAGDADTLAKAMELPTRRWPRD